MADKSQVSVMERISDSLATWMRLDPSVESKEYIMGLFQREEWLILDQLLNNRLVFGTAGLRAPMGPGFAQMNTVTVLQASQGLAQYIMHTSEAKERIVVIGHDHRWNSLEFANVTASVFLLAGFDVYFIGPGVCATPMVPFAVDLLHAQAGIMITASHNPKDDNGYKVYWSNGCQIIPPLDKGIQDSILDNLEPSIGFTWHHEKVFSEFSDKLHFCKSTIGPKYINHLKKVLLKCDSISGFNCVYTAMHGVGTEFVNSLMKSIDNSCDVLLNLQAQCTPDPDFPTVKFPNPEEKGALNLAMAYADSVNCPLVIANDPDADRFSFAFKSSGTGWKQFTGNEIGTLFGDFTISTYTGGDLSNVWLLNSTVSSQMLKSVAVVEGFNYQDTLTGFKWIGNKAIDLESEGKVVPFGYEEAIGFMFPTVHDKDGISALLMFLQMYQWHLQMGTNPLKRLNSLYKKYGYFKECNGYFKTTNTDEIFNENIRGANGKAPLAIGDWTVVSWRDLTIGYDSETADHVPLLPVDPDSQMITSLIEKDGVQVRFTLRGSGTEPKLKYYIESVSRTELEAESAAEAAFQLLKREFNLDSN